MKYVKFISTGLEGKTHIVPKHTKRTLCGYKVRNDFIEDKWEGAYASCLYCVESLEDLIEKASASISTSFDLVDKGTHA